MFKLSTDEIEIIKKTEALPKSVIARRLSELMDTTLMSKSQEEFKDMRLFMIELRAWLKTIKLFTKKEQEIKKEDFI